MDFSVGSRVKTLPHMAPMQDFDPEISVRIRNHKNLFSNFNIKGLFCSEIPLPFPNSSNMVDHKVLEKYKIHTDCWVIANIHHNFIYFLTEYTDTMV